MISQEKLLNPKSRPHRQLSSRLLALFCCVCKEAKNDSWHTDSQQSERQLTKQTDTQLSKRSLHEDKIKKKKKKKKKFISTNLALSEFVHNFMAVWQKPVCVFKLAVDALLSLFTEMTAQLALVITARARVCLENSLAIKATVSSSALIRGHSLHFKTHQSVIGGKEMVILESMLYIEIVAQEKNVKIRNNWAKKWGFDLDNEWAINAALN